MPALKNYQRLVGIFLVSAATLIFEIALTRVFSISIWYHFSFMVISIALFGFGASGALLAAIPWLSDDPRRRLSQYAYGVAATSVFAYLASRLMPLDPFLLITQVNGAATFRPEQLFFLLIFYLLFFVPFFLGGLVIGLLFLVEKERSNLLYGWDLAGAALGCPLAVGIIATLGAPAAIVLAGLLALVGAVTLRGDLDGRFGIFSGALGIFLVVLLVFKGAIEPVPSPTKGISYLRNTFRNARTVHTEWNALSRIDVTAVDTGLNSRYLPGMGTNFPGRLPEQRFLSIDGDAFSMLNRLENGVEGADFLDYALYSTAYQVKNDAPEVLCIGLGGGSDIMTALRNGSASVTGVEINPGSLSVTGNVMADWVGNIYQDPRVTIVNDEGRSFIRRLEGELDVIQMSGVDTWSGLATGAYTLSENYLYTTDAFEDFLRHLKDDGVLSIIRYVFAPPRETLRLCSVGAAALERVTGVTDPSRHVAVISNHGAESHPYASFLLKKSPFTEAEIDRLETWTLEKGFTPLYLPGRPSITKFHAFLTAEDPEAFYDEYIYNIRPVGDDSPFFFKYYKWSNIMAAPAGQGGNLGANIPIGHLVLLAVLLQAVILGTVIVAAPLFTLSQKGLGLNGAGASLVYFSCLGIGFMLVELTLIQKLTLFLGHPTYAVVVALFGILLSTAVGSILAGYSKDRRGLLLLALPILVAVVVVYAFGIDGYTKLFLGASLWVRMALALVVIFPLGALLGVPFATAIAYLHETDREALVPWAWGVNGCTSVVGSVGAVLIAMSSSYTLAFLAGAALYALAAVAIWQLKPQR